MTNYNRVPFVKKVRPDLTGFVTEKAVNSLFVKIAEEEKRIKENPVARTTELMKRVFAN